MKVRSVLFGATLALVGIFAAPPSQTAHAQVVVCANCSTIYTQLLEYAKMVEEVVELKRQTEEAIKTLTNLDDTLKSITDVRGFARIAVESYKDLLPPEFSQLQNLVAGTGRVSDIARMERDLLSQLNLEYMSPSKIGNAAWTRFESEIRRRAENKAMAAEEFDSSQDRFQRLDYLRDSIDYTDDQKGILEVNARLTAENVSAINELIKLTAAKNLQQAQIEREELFYRQDGMKAAAASY